MVMRLAILISGRGSNMLALEEALAPHQDKGRIDLVIADKSCAGLALAKERGLKIGQIDYAARGKKDAEAELAEMLEAAEIDMILLAGFMRVLSAAFVARFEGRIINIHPSLLPKYKGLNTHQRALDAGDSEHGVSVHLVTAGLDEGPLIAQASVPIYPEDDETSLSERLLPAEHALYAMVIITLLKGTLILTAQGAKWQEMPDEPLAAGDLLYPSR